MGQYYLIVDDDRGYNLRKIVAGVPLDPLPAPAVKPEIVILEPVEEKPVSWLAHVETDAGVE